MDLQAMPQVQDGFRVLKAIPEPGAVLASDTRTKKIWQNPDLVLTCASLPRGLSVSPAPPGSWSRAGTLREGTGGLGVRTGWT